MRKGRRGLVIGGMVIGLLLGFNSGAIAELEKKSSFYESVVKIGQGFQEIFGIFGNAMGEALGLTAVKSSDNKSKVGEHFDNLGKGLKKTKDNLDELATKIIGSTVNVDVTGVNSIIKSVGAVIEKLINSVNNLAGVTAKGGATNIVGVSGGNALKGAKAVSAANGADILSAIEEAAKAGTSKGSGQINVATNAFEMAIATKNDGTADKVKTNASVIAAGLALKAMAQGGKLAAKASDAPAEGLNTVLIEAVGKTVNEIVSIIRRTVDKCLKDVSDCIKEDSSSVEKSK